ncbi:hypothetical protein Pint_08312 [Pistacia integerrima]|uniref:Uncharacterized protein n=1 Tax=Pistacia integerrima TaxID=434235 RepID=A0ACC0Y0Y7_9ROSI|nr:hypothetical protein Pint_08312 [Pistacia integerrima]
MWFTDCVVPALRARRAVGKIALCACIIGCLKVDAFGSYVEYQPLVHQFTGLVVINVGAVVGFSVSDSLESSHLEDVMVHSLDVQMHKRMVSEKVCRMLDG